jgi:hypothetical protein
VGGDPVRERALLGALKMTRRQLGQSNAALVRMALPPLPRIATASRRVAVRARDAGAAAVPPLVGEIASLAKAVRAHCAAPRVVDLAALGRQRDAERAREAARVTRVARWYSSARGRGVESKSDDVAAAAAAAAATKTVEEAPRLGSITAREAWLGRVHSTARLAAQYDELRARVVAAALSAGATQRAPRSDLSPEAERRRHISVVRASKVRAPR